MSSNSSLICEQSKVIIRCLHESGVIKVEIETPRLLIRSYQDEDFKNSLALYSNPKIIKYFDSGTIKSKEEVEKLIKYYRDLSDCGVLGLFSIFKKDCMNFIGHLDLAPSDQDGVIEVGYIFNEKFHSQGFCTEAIKAILFDYMETILMRRREEGKAPIKGIMATVHPNNTPSIRILTKIGMKFQRFLERFGHPRFEYYLEIKKTS